MKLELHEPRWLSMGATIRAYRLYRTDDLAICIECSEVAENRGRLTYSGRAACHPGSSCRCWLTMKASTESCHGGASQTGQIMLPSHTDMAAFGKFYAKTLIGEDSFEAICQVLSVVWFDE